MVAALALEPLTPLTETAEAPQRELFIATDLTDEVMASFYLQLFHEGLLEQAFYAGVPTISEFLTWHKRPDCLAIGAFVRSPAEHVPGLGKISRKEGAEAYQSNRSELAHTEPLRLADEAAGQVQMAGLVFLYSIRGVPGAVRADISIVFLRKFQRRAITIPLSRLVMAHGFERGLDVLYGISSPEGRAAIALARALGFEQTSLLPLYGVYNGRPSDAIMSFITKDRFYELQGRGAGST